LENKPDKGIAVAIKVALREIFATSALDDNFPARRIIQSPAYVQQGGLTAPAFPEQKHHSCFRKTQGHVVQRAYVCPALSFIDF